MLVGTFRILDLSFNGDLIEIQMAAKRPWDNLQSPSEKSDTGVYVPIVYGDYTGAVANSTVSTNNVFMDNASVFPAPKPATNAGN